MKKAFVLLASLAVISLVLAGCGSGGNSNNVPQNFTDPSATIKVKAGEEFTISLDANATTGYEWKLAKTLDESIIEQVGDPQYLTEEGAEDRIGAGGTEVWTFRGVGRGDTTIYFEYVRPWEKEEEPAQTRDFKVDVS